MAHSIGIPVERLAGAASVDGGPGGQRLELRSPVGHQRRPNQVGSSRGAPGAPGGQAEESKLPAGGKVVNPSRPTDPGAVDASGMNWLGKGGPW